jgi:hypothetical protein
MRAHGNLRAREVYGSVGPPNGVTKEDVTQWKQYLTDKYVHKKFAPSDGSSTAVPPISTPPASSMRKFSPRSPSKFTNQPMPNIDLIHFDSPSSDHEPVDVIVSEPKASEDFFGKFGL